ncbi:hypothetical protein N9961_01380 [bacterium]|nr:hypothetical protein [bacterium]
MGIKASSNLAICGLLAGITGHLSAASFHPIASVIANTSGSDPVSVDRLILGPGLGFDANSPHDAIHGAVIWDSVWYTQACGFPCDYYLTLPTPVLTLDLSQDRPLNEISLWGFVQSNTNGAKRASLRFATASEGTAGFGSSITFNPSFSLINDESIRQSFAFGRSITARYVELTLSDNFFVAPGDGSQGETLGGDRVGLGEIAFAVPEILSTPHDNLIATAPQAFSLVDGTTGTAPLSTLLAGENYWSTALDPDSGKVYLSVPTNSEIRVMDLSSSTPTSTTFITLSGAVFHGLAIDRDSKLLYALDSGSDSILSFDLDTGTPGGTLASASLHRPNELVFDAERDWLVLSDSGLDQVRVYDTSGSLLHNLSHASTVGAWGLAIDPTNQDILYSTHDLGQIWRWSPGNVPTLEHDNLQGPRGLGYDRWGRLYCMESGTGEIKTFNTNPLTFYSTALGGRDLTLFGECDLDNDFIPDEWESNFSSASLNYWSDPDNDGTPAILEAALNGTPLSGIDQRISSLVISADGEIVVSHPALKKSNLRYQLWLSDDLENWQEANRIPSVESGTGLYDTWSYTFSPAEEGFAPATTRLFTRTSVLPVE